MRVLIFYFLIFSFIDAKYLDSKSCAECHQDIYNEHIKSMHHHSSIHKDSFHEAVKNKTTPDKYDCAFCHSPASPNLLALKNGEERPNNRNSEEIDGVSCFYCHQINKVFESKHQNINFYGYQGGKPTFFANLSEPDFSDKHANQSNEIFQNSRVCMGCHSHKYNSSLVEICNTKSALDETISDCLSCHMPKTAGSPVNVNKKGRSEYATHGFLGIRDEGMVKKAVELKLAQLKDGFRLEIKNKMGHPVILQPMRLKYVEIEVIRNGKIVWKNFDKSPLEDKESTFTITFKNSDNVEVLPPQAKDFLFKNNLSRNKTKVIEYKVQLEPKDKIKATWKSMISRPQLAEELGLSNEYRKIYEGISETLIIK